MKLKESFQSQVNSFLLSMRGSIPIREIESELREKSIFKAVLSQQQFEDIFWAYLSALVSQRWTRCCLENRFDSKEIQNLFFRTVLDAYAEKKDLDGAASFSEAMYAANSEEDQEPLVSILAAFFKKIGMSESLTSAEVVETFRWLAGVWEGYCNHFDNEFDDFVALLRVTAAPQAQPGKPAAFINKESNRKRGVND